METDFVDWLLRRIPADARLEVPPGDDAAVLRPPANRRTVVTVDMLMEGVDFVLGPDCPPPAVGHKALAVNLSDLAAMGSRPEAAVVGRTDPTTGQAIAAFVILRAGAEPSDDLVAALRDHVGATIGPIAKPKSILFTDDLPKTRSGKIMRRLLREIAASGNVVGDVTTLEDFTVIEKLRDDED